MIAEKTIKVYVCDLCEEAAPQHKTLIEIRRVGELHAKERLLHFCYDCLRKYQPKDLHAFIATTLASIEITGENKK